MDYERIKTEYLCYLMNRAKIDAEGDYGYLNLCKVLMDFQFIPIVEMDENRCYECRDLRREFSYDYDEEYGDILDGIYGEYGTMMELLVVLAEKMDYDLADSEFEAGAGKWFMEMLGNCGLATAFNTSFEQDGFEEEVTDILCTIVYRKFGWDGEGSLFPLQWPRQDQRNVELIIQMNNYIEENYDIC